MLQYEKKARINPYSLKKFKLGKRYDPAELWISDGVIVVASDPYSNGKTHSLVSDEPNWEKASNVLLQFYREDYSTFCEILKMLDRDAEEYKELQSAMENSIYSITSKLQSEIQNYESLLKRF